MAKHRLGDVEIRYYPIVHRPDGDNITGGSPKHVLCLQTYRKHPVFHPVIRTNGDNGRLTQYDPLAANIDQRIGCTEVDGQIIGKNTQQCIQKHLVASFDEKNRTGGLFGFLKLTHSGNRKTG
jgi:hypothetical protein